MVTLTVLGLAGYAIHLRNDDMAAGCLLLAGFTFLLEGMALAGVAKAIWGVG